MHLLYVRVIKRRWRHIHLLHVLALLHGKLLLQKQVVRGVH